MSLLSLLLACGEPEPVDVPAPAAEVVADEPGSPYLDQPDAVERVAARHVLVPWEGARAAPLGTSLSREEAVAKVAQLREQVLAGEPFAKVARKHSTDGTRNRGGWLGSFQRGTMDEAFEDAVWRLPIGGVSLPVETPFGAHLILREPLEEVKLRHLMLAHSEANHVAKDSPAATREKTQALALMTQAREAIVAEGGDFAAVAAQVGETPMSRRGADLGWFFQAELGAYFDDAVAQLEVGEVSEVIETPLGFHLVERVE